MERHLYGITTTENMEVTGKNGPVKSSYFYVLAGTFEEALAKFRDKYPAMINKIRQIALVDYHNGLPILE